MSLFGFQAFKTWIFLRKFTLQQVLKSFFGRNNSVELSVYGFSNSLSYGLEESREWRALISQILGQYMLKNAEYFCQQVFLEPPLWIYSFEILIFLLSNIIPRGVTTCRMLFFKPELVLRNIKNQKYKALKIINLL